MYKVCHISSAHPQEDVRIYQKECISLVEEGYKVYLITQGKKQKKRGVCFVGLGEMPSSRLKRMLLFTRKAYKAALKINADIYHIHDPELLPYALKLKHNGKKVIFDSHEFTALQLSGGSRKYIPKPIRKLVGIIYMKYERYVTRHIDGVVIPCKRKGKDYFGGNYKNIAYVNNVPRLSEMNYNRQIEKKENTTVYVGSITKERGIINTIKASYLAGCKLQLVGDIDDELLRELQQMPEYAAVNYYGRLPVEVFSGIIQESNVGLCLLRNIGQYDEGDNLSTKVYEYMSLGIPIVASDFRMNKKIIEGNQCGICADPDDYKAIVDAIKTLLNNPELSEEMGQNGRNLVEKKYCWEVEEKKLFDLYSRILLG